MLGKQWEPEDDAYLVLMSSEIRYGGALFKVKRTPRGFRVVARTGWMS